MHWLTKMAMKLAMEQREHGADQNYLWNNPDKIKKVEEIFEEYKRRNMEKIRVFLSLPMSGFTDEEIQENINKMKSVIMLKNPFGEVEIEFVDNSDYEPPMEMLKNPVTPNLLYLGQAIKRMATCNAAVFHPEYSFSRGCNIELDVCKAYGIPAYGIDEFHGFGFVPLHTNYWGKKLYKEAKIDEHSDNC